MAHPIAQVLLLFSLLSRKFFTPVVTRPSVTVTAFPPSPCSFPALQLLFVEPIQVVEVERHSSFLDTTTIVLTLLAAALTYLAYSSTRVTTGGQQDGCNVFTSSSSPISLSDDDINTALDTLDVDTTAKTISPPTSLHPQTKGGEAALSTDAEWTEISMSPPFETEVAYILSLSRIVIDDATPALTFELGKTFFPSLTSDAFPRPVTPETPIVSVYDTSASSSRASSVPVQETIIATTQTVAELTTELEEIPTLSIVEETQVAKETLQAPSFLSGTPSTVPPRGRSTIPTPLATPHLIADDLALRDPWSVSDHFTRRSKSVPPVAHNAVTVVHTHVVYIVAPLVLPGHLAANEDTANKSADIPVFSISRRNGCRLVKKLFADNIQAFLLVPGAEEETNESPQELFERLDEEQSATTVGPDVPGQTESRLTPPLSPVNDILDGETPYVPRVALPAALGAVIPLCVRKSTVLPSIRSTKHPRRNTQGLRKAVNRPPLELLVMPPPPPLHLPTNVNFTFPRTRPPFSNQRRLPPRLLTNPHPRGPPECFPLSVLPIHISHRPRLPSIPCPLFPPPPPPPRPFLPPLPPPQLIPLPPLQQPRPRPPIESYTFMRHFPR